jgi:uncharacterized protein (DUF2147 family)
MKSGGTFGFALLQLLALLTGTFATMANAQAITPEGRWLTEDKSGVIEIYRCGAGELCGRLAWFRIKPEDDKDNPKALDIQNPTPGLRTRPLCGLVILSGFRPDGENHWSGGSAYDPESGHTYSGKMTLKPDGTLSLRGYIGVSLFGRSEEWTRYTQAITSCPAK